MMYYIRISYKTKNTYKDQYGNSLKNKKIIDQFDKLYIVPSYKEVKFYYLKNKIYASALDNKGRTQYSYNKEFKEKREEKKLHNLKKFLSIIDKLDKKINCDLNQTYNIKNAPKLYQNSLCVPSDDGISNSDVDIISNFIKKFHDKKKMYQKK